jgi:hypothetical protein
MAGLALILLRARRGFMRGTSKKIITGGLKQAKEGFGILNG